jgi:hypothetical protein
MGTCPRQIPIYHKHALNTCIDGTCINEQAPSPRHTVPANKEVSFHANKTQNWKQHLKTYHLVRKAIHIINIHPYPTWITHPNMQQLQTLTIIIFIFVFNRIVLLHF